jgi:hypothetical protein
MDVIDGVGLPGSCSTKVKYLKNRNSPSYLGYTKKFGASRILKDAVYRIQMSIA